MIEGLEWVFIAANVLGAGAWIYLRKKEFPNPLFGWLYMVLYLFHLGMGGYFFDHVLSSGGDSLFYWKLPWYFDREYSAWVMHYGYGNYFMQTFNSPLIWSGVGFLGGTVLYNFLSFVGIGLIYEKAAAILASKGVENILPILFSFVLCMSPGLHFWTGGVSKEAFLILAFGLVFHYSGSHDLRSVLLCFLGFFLALHVRLVTGLVLAVPFLWMLVSNRKISGTMRIIFSSVTALLCLLGMRFMRVLIQVDELSWESISDVSAYQLGQLENLRAKSHIPLIDMAFPERILAILFRPFPWEVWDFYSLVFALENMLLLILMLCGTYFILKDHIRIPGHLLGLLAVAMAMVLIYAFTLNNFGIIYRMKSIFLPFLSMPFTWVIYIRLVDREKFIS